MPGLVPGGDAAGPGMRRRVSPGSLRDYWGGVTGDGVCVRVCECVRGWRRGEPGPYSVKDLSRHARNL